MVKGVFLNQKGKTDLAIKDRISLNNMKSNEMKTLGHMLFKS